MSPSKSSYWSITINNPTDDDHRQWNGLKGMTWVKEVAGQLEKGEEGTLHIQGMVKTDYGRYFQKLREALPRAHIEIAKNKFAIQNYVKKEETRVAEIPKVKVATQADVQNKLLQVMIEQGWRQYMWTGDPRTNFPDFLGQNAYKIREDWESWTDNAVRELIREGYYGVEFVMSNNQVRSAFRKYIVEIMYRQWHATATATQSSIAPTSEDRSEPICEDLE